jgi:hemerythrin-like domain-containing protein
MMNVVEIGIELIEKGQQVPDDFLSNAVEFFWEFAVQFHFEKEEELLFNEMEKAGLFIEELPIEAFKHEHQIQREYMERLFKDLSNYKSCEGRANCAEKEQKFFQDLSAFFQILRRHSIREDRVLYPMSDRLIAQKNDLKLIEYYTKMENRYGGYQEKYQNLVEKYESLLKSPAD